MLELKKISKIYTGKNTEVNALRGIDVAFRKSEFVSVLGPSGCGKTTLLNIIGGLDRYTSGELIVDGKPTSDFSDRDWDTYRNRKIGFVFQNYNLIAHETVLENVELALTLSGVSAISKKRRAMKALERVGLAEHLRKKPSELSGGEMQRVAIARAVVNEPEIILADEPTGALDSKNSVQIMDLLKEISQDRLIIMVTHNEALANEYSTRVIKLFDGLVVADSNPYTAAQIDKDIAENVENRSRADVASSRKGTEKNRNKAKNAVGKGGKSGKGGNGGKNDNNIGAKDKGESVKADANAYNADRSDAVLGKKDTKDVGGNKLKKHTSMSFAVALALSFKNLMTKKTRTVLTALASSIGIIGLALVLALFNGLNIFLKKVQYDTLTGYPMYVTTSASTDTEAYLSIIIDSSNYISDPNMKDKIFVSHLITQLKNTTVRNKITEKYLNYVKSTPEDLVRDIGYDYGISMNIFKKQVSLDFTEYKNSGAPGASIIPDTIPFKYPQVTSGSYFKELVGDKDFILSQYDLVAGKYPTEKNELCLVLDKNNRITDTMLVAFLIDVTATHKDENGKYTVNEYEYDDFLGKLYADGTRGASEYGEFALALNNGLYVNNPEENYFETRLVSVYSYLTAMYGSAIAKRITEGLQSSGVTLPNIYNGEPAQTLDLKISGILRLNDQTTTGAMGSYPVGYTSALTEYVLEQAAASNVVAAQLEEGKKISDGNDETKCRNVLVKDQYVTKNGEQVENSDYYIATETALNTKLKKLGYSEVPKSIYFYATSFENKLTLKKYLAAYNETVADDDKVFPTDMVSAVINVLQTFIDTITYILLALTGISLLVAAIMIAIITYISVIERTREIGVLRSIGARKIDVANVFNAETVIIGLFSGVLGILLAYILQFPLNALLYSFTGIANLAALSWLHALLLIGVSVAVTFISGMIPSYLASKRDPVKALRSGD